MGFLDSLIGGVQKEMDNYEKRMRRNIAGHSDDEILRILRNPSSDASPQMLRWVEDEARKRGIY